MSADLFKNLNKSTALVIAIADLRSKWKKPVS